MLIKDVKQYSPLGLAYIGDCVYELMVRERIIEQGNAPVNKLHKSTIKYVCASAQSNAVDKIMETLTDDEVAIYKRGRNANGSTVPKNAHPMEYRRATGLEALFGYLYLTEQMARLCALFEIIFDEPVHVIIKEDDFSDEERKTDNKGGI